MAHVELQGIGRRFATDGGSVEALRDVDLSIDAGDYVALLGPSGSGKSTLLHILGCLDRPTAGRYLFEGADVGGLDVRRLAALRNGRIGFVFQRFHLLPRQTARQNVELPLRLGGVGAGERQRRATDLLRRVGLGDRLDHRPAQLSGGQQQRVAIARALVNHPGLVLADEPTGNLDSRSGAEIVTLLEELVGEGHTVVLVTHDEQLALRTRRVVRLHDGRLVEDSRPDNAGDTR